MEWNTYKMCQLELWYRNYIINDNYSSLTNEHSIRFIICQREKFLVISQRSTVGVKVSTGSLFLLLQYFFCLLHQWINNGHKLDISQLLQSLGVVPWAWMRYQTLKYNTKLPIKLLKQYCCVFTSHIDSIKYKYSVNIHT